MIWGDRGDGRGAMGDTWPGICSGSPAGIESTRIAIAPITGERSSMRFRTLVAWVVIVGLLAWAAYTIVVAGSSYLATAGVIDQAVSDAIARRKAQIGSGMTHEANRDFLANVRSSIVGGARARGIELPP